MDDKQTILVVDDDHAMRGMLETALSSFGYHVLPASSGAEALRVWREQAKPVDLLLTDIRLGGMNGCELAMALNELQPGIPVLYMSGGTQDEIEELVKLPQPASFVGKPFRLGALRETLRDIFAAVRL
jgi:two-component system cell cycle sensor histidine kinase/response regulator CckA